MKRSFDEWLDGFRTSIADYKYYVDFEKVFLNVEQIKVELHILNSLIGSKSIEADFVKLIDRYPQVLKCVPILMAKRELEIRATDEDGAFEYRFNEKAHTAEQYCAFMRKTGLFDLLENHITGNLVDYVTGVETGLDSNGRKNRGGHLMENLVEDYLTKAGLVKDESYFKEMYISEIEKRWGVDLSCISNKGTTEKRFDFVIKCDRCIYGVETNFYIGGGSKLNETARSYKTIALETAGLDYFRFVWFTDGEGWLSAKNNLKETFDVLDELYNIQDLENGVINRLIEKL